MTQTSELNELIADVRERVLYLQELGVETLDADLAPLGMENGKLKVESAELSRIAVNPVPEINFKKETPVEPRSPGQSRLASLPSLSKRSAAVPFHKSGTNGTDGGTRPDESAAEGTIHMQKSENKTETLFDATPALPEPIETIEQIRAEIGPDCTRCKLSTLGRSQVVNSVGNFNADLMFVGEAPGADEDEQGEPFVGRAGQLLTDIIEKGLGIPRSDVFIGNINRCRPPKNRAPEPDETVACKPFLKREIAVVRPKVIVVLGATAAQNLLETKVPIGKLRGQFHDYLGVKVMPTFHPAYLLRDPHKKREVWEDMKLVRDHLKL